MFAILLLLQKEGFDGRPEFNCVPYIFGVEAVKTLKLLKYFLHICSFIFCIFGSLHFLNVLICLRFVKRLTYFRLHEDFFSRAIYHVRIVVLSGYCYVIIIIIIIIISLLSWSKRI